MAKDRHQVGHWRQGEVAIERTTQGRRVATSRAEIGVALLIRGDVPSPVRLARQINRAAPPLTRLLTRNRDVMKSGAVSTT